MPATTSDFIARMLALSPEQRREVLMELPTDAKRRLLSTWSLWARPSQLWRPVEGVSRYVYTAGRGWGKNAVGANATITVARHPWLCGGKRMRDGSTRGGWIGIAGRTANDVNNTMVGGDNGIMRWSPPDFVPEWNKSDKVLTWPNGVTARLFSGDSPPSFRGPNLGMLWADELSYWSKRAEAWKAARGMVRVGDCPITIVTTTPKGDDETVRLVFEVGEDGHPLIAPADTPPHRQLQGHLLNPGTIVVTGDTRENAANVAATWLDDMRSVHAGSESEATELKGEIPLQSANAGVRWTWIRRADELDEADPLIYRGIAIDPSGSETGAEVGMIVFGVSRSRRLYLLRDASLRCSPQQWASLAGQLMRTWEVSRLVYEANYGQGLVEAILRSVLGSAALSVQFVPVHARQSKWERLMSVRHRWELGHVIEVSDDPRSFARLELELTRYDPHSDAWLGVNSPGRMDAAVWAAIDTFGTGMHQRAVAPLAGWSKIAT